MIQIRLRVEILRLPQKQNLVKVGHIHQELHISVRNIDIVRILKVAKNRFSVLKACKLPY